MFALGFWYGGILVDTGEMSFEEVLKVFIAIQLATMGIGQAQMAFPDAAKGKTAVARIFRGPPPPGLSRMMTPQRLADGRWCSARLSVRVIGLGSGPWTYTCTMHACIQACALPFRCTLLSCTYQEVGVQAV